MVFSLQIGVSDIVKVHKDEEFPADLLLLSSSDPSGRCSVNSSNVDGETALKISYCLPRTASFKEEEISQLCCETECEAPSENINEFAGNLIIEEQKCILGLF